ncbi:penicillin acylase [Rhizocola hellebori]|uniref:Penicillin acylase n=2 Tax=Rhizocola hellebori TaxID=1392758 RepID=A0A8J3QHK2_9ACTN|nr:penicillin acylase [Rhizocola hellebori]
MLSKVTRAGMALVLVTTALVLAPASPATAASAYLQPNDYCLDQCDDILPPGQNGNATLAEILAQQALGIRPAHNADQIGKYANLLSAYTGLTGEQIGQFYNDAAFGVPASQVESTSSPRSDVTILRDKATGVPHIYGTTRGGTMFGAGYAGASDRLFLMDLLRRVGRGKLTSFAGGSPGNQALEQQVWRNSPYTEADLQVQVEALRVSGPRGALLHSDITEFVAGINAYINRCMSAIPINCPGEYVLTGHLDAITGAGGPEPFTITDIVSISGVVGGLFGGGGGNEMRSALVRLEAQAKYGTVVGDQVWRAFREQNDPETVLTLHNGQSFPYGQTPAAASGVALPDRGTASPVPVVFNRSGSAGTPITSPEERGILPNLNIGPESRRGMSNAMVVSGAHTATGNPIAVFGPQTAYFSPQLLLLQELQGPGISARGASFAGVNLYVQLGRGQDYAWSATSAGQDITDTYSVELCGDINSTVYRFRGVCTPMEQLRQDNAWTPTLADSTPAGSYSLITYRTKYGLVLWRGLVNGVPTAFTSLRSTYRHEADSALGFQMFNDPAQMGTAAAFVTSASNVGYAFNWFYVNSAEAAYFNSGSNPVRPSHVDPNLPIAATAANEWVGWNPDNNTASYTPTSAHPQAVNQDYFISWNNKQAKDYSAADGNFSFGPVHRGDMLDKAVKAAIAGGQKLDRAGVVKLVEAAAHEDLRATHDLGLLLQVITSQPVTDPAQADAVAKLQAWLANGGHRTETGAGSHVYRDADAIRILDAWWPRLVDGMFRPSLGDSLFASLAGAIQIDEAPSDHGQPHKGSSFQTGWWGYVSKDLRSVLGQPVAGPLAATYCGAGNLAACRSVLLSTLATAAAVPASQVYPGDGDCAAGDQWCADTIIHSALGGIGQDPISWQNRPTYQQVVQFPARRGDNIANLAHNKTATASSTQFLTSLTPNKAVDANDGSRWGSSFSNNQWIKVDLGSAQTVGRVILNWESAYGRSYRIEVSNDNTNWTTVFSTTAGNGGTDNISFAPVSARYVRMFGLTRATSYGFSLYEFDIYAK